MLAKTPTKGGEPKTPRQSKTPKSAEKTPRGQSKSETICAAGTLVNLSRCKAKVQSIDLPLIDQPSNGNGQAISF